VSSETDGAWARLEQLLKSHSLSDALHIMRDPRNALPFRAPDPDGPRYRNERRDPYLDHPTGNEPGA
jgi:hypothetical protein